MRYELQFPSKGMMFTFRFPSESPRLRKSDAASSAEIRFEMPSFQVLFRPAYIITSDMLLITVVLFRGVFSFIVGELANRVCSASGMKIARIRIKMLIAPKQTSSRLRLRIVTDAFLKQHKMSFYATDIFLMAVFLIVWVSSYLGAQENPNAFSSNDLFTVRSAFYSV